MDQGKICEWQNLVTPFKASTPSTISTFNYSNFMPLFLNVHFCWKHECPLIPMIQILSFPLRLKWALPYSSQEDISPTQQFSKCALQEPPKVPETFSQIQEVKTIPFLLQSSHKHTAELSKGYMICDSCFYIQAGEM